MFKKLRMIFVKGLLFVIPVLFFSYIAVIVFNFFSILINPLINILPKDGYLSVPLQKLTTVFILFIIILIFGFLVNKGLGATFISKVEFIIPGFALIKRIFTRDAEFLDRKAHTCIVTIDDAWLFGLIIEEHKSGMVTVFVPGAPNPTSGNVYFFTKDQVKHLDIPFQEAMKRLIQFGYGSKDILDDRVKWLI